MSLAIVRAVMNTIRRRTFAAALLATLSFGLTNIRAETLPRLKVVDGRIVNPEGQPVALRGVNLGNWLLIEPGGLGGSAGGAVGKFADQAGLFHILRDRFGEAERRRLIDVYRDSYITARDFDNAKTFGFNLLRVGFDHELLEDADKPFVLRPDAFKYLDYAIEQAKARGMYVVFDLHGAQGRQVSGKQGGDNSRADFWDVPDNQERAFWMWEQIAKRYVNEPTVFGYQVLNEPFSGTDAQTLDVSKRWFPRMRAIDKNAVLILPGMYSGVGFYGDPASHGWENCMFDLHFYPGVAFTGPAATQPSTTQSAVRPLHRRWPQLAEDLRKIKTPLLVGELSIVYKSGGGGEMIRRYTDFATENGWAVCIWTLKELTLKGGVSDKMWMLTTNEQPLTPVEIRTSSKEKIEAAFRSFATMPLVIDEDVRHWQTTSQRPATLPVEEPTTRP